MNWLKTKNSAILLVIICALFSVSESLAQKSKREEIYKNKLYKDYLDVHYMYDEENKVTSKQVILYGQDLRYQQIVETVHVYSGSPKELMSFMNEVEKFFNENDPEFSTVINGRKMKVVKQAGIKGFYLYEENGNGYRGYNIKSWEKIKNALVEWAKKNNEPLN